jgi:hypothetical protein
LGDASIETDLALLEGAGLVLTPETGRITVGIGFAGCADVEELGVIAEAEMEAMLDGGRNGFSNCAGLGLTSDGGREGAIQTGGLEVTCGAIREGAVDGVRGEYKTGFSSGLCRTGGPAVADRPGAIVNGPRIALASTTSWWITRTTNTIADSPTPVRKAASTRVI